MFGGYYGHPSASRSYIPQSSMTAFASGDTIATNSFVGDEFPQESNIEYDDNSAEETTEKRKSTHRSLPVNPATADEDGYAEADVTPAKPKRIPKRKPQKPQVSDEDENDEIPASWPFSGGRNGAPSYNAFFPIMLGGGSNGGPKARSDIEEGGYYPGAATAIANSFSTGKGGVATSHATSFGDPYLSSLFRSGTFNKKSKPSVQEN